MSRQRLFARVRPLDVLSTTRLAAILGGALVCGAIWASFATLEEQIRAPGRVIASSRSQVIQAVDGGVLKQLHVKEGDIVKQGDLLAELDPARFQASNEEMVVKVINLQASVERLQAELDMKPLEFSADVKAYPDIAAAQTDLHHRRLQLQEEEISSIEKSLKLADAELRALESLAKTGDAAQTEVLRARRQVNELQGTATNKRNTYRQDAQTELAKNRSELEQSQQVLAQRGEALRSTHLVAPMAGAVKNIRITTRGAVLRAGDELMQIVPTDDPLIIEARVRSQDVAFVRVSLRANAKFDAYDYTLYGSLKGHVTYISPDTIDQDLARDEKPYYRALVEIDPEELRLASGRKMDILPGMTTVVEIITGERTVAGYLLRPLRRTASEALTER